MCGWLGAVIAQRQNNTTKNNKYSLPVRGYTRDCTSRRLTAEHPGMSGRWQINMSDVGIYFEGWIFPLTKREVVKQSGEKNEEQDRGRTEYPLNRRGQHI